MTGEGPRPAGSVFDASLGGCAAASTAVVASAPDRIAGERMIDPALLPGDSLWRQTNRLLRLHTPLGEDILLAEGFEAVECLGPVDKHAGFRIELTALSADATIDLAALLGQAVRVDLLTSLSRSWRRPFHGHCTRVSRLGANGGFARYRLQIEPWLAFLGQGRDNYIFSGTGRSSRSSTSSLATGSAKGRLDPAWRWEIADRSVYPRRSITTQFQESDLAFGAPPADRGGTVLLVRA